MKTNLFILFMFLTFNSFGQQFDIIPFPGEEKPEKILNKRDVMAGPSNWGEDLLLPEALLTELAQRAKYNVVVKVFDTGAGYSHTDLQQGLLSGSNFCSPAGSPTDIQGHSTHVAGIIASKYLGLTRTLVEKGLLKFKPVKVLNDNGSGDFGWLANAIAKEDEENKNYLANGTFVVGNMSLGGGTGKVTSVENSLKASKTLGVIYCVAAGNTGTLGVNYPGNSEYVIATGSIGQDKKRSSFSTFGPEVWNGQPGSSIYSTYLNNQYASLSGTSMATPFETSLAAIALSVWGKDLANLETMKKYLAWISTDILPAGKDNETGHGYSLVRSILDKDPKNIPGGGNPTDPNPPAPNPPVHAKRDLYFSYNTNYTMFWNVVTNQNVKKQPILFDVTDPTGVEALTITKLEVVVLGSTLFGEDEEKKIKSELDLFFTSRGLGLSPGSDYTDATSWTSYFLDLILTTQRKYPIDVIRIEAKNQKGQSVLFLKENLKKFSEKTVK